MRILAGLFLIRFILAGMAWAAPSNDRAAAAIALTGWTAASTVDPTGARTMDGDPLAPAPAPTAVNTDVSLWWTYTPPVDGEVSVIVTSPTLPTETTTHVFLLLYDAQPTPNKTKTTASNYFEFRFGGNLTPSMPWAFPGLDGRFQGKAGQIYVIEVILNTT